MLLSGDLPAALAAFESQRRNTSASPAAPNEEAPPLIDPALMPQVEAFARENPNVPIQPAALVQMIISLQDAYSGSHSRDQSFASQNEEDDVPDVRHILSDSSQMSSSSDSQSDSSEDGDSMRMDEGDDATRRRRRDDTWTVLHKASTSREETPMPHESEPVAAGETGAHPFPQGKASPDAGVSDDDGVIGKDYSASRAVSSASTKRRSSGMDFTAAPGSDSRNRKVSRDRKSSASVRSSAAAEGSGGEGSQPRSRKSSTTPAEDKEILKGKGRAKGPPSSWSRPKPQALAQRSRRISGTSSSTNSTTNSPMITSFGDDVHNLGLGRPSEFPSRASRFASQPATGRPYASDDEVEADANNAGRSVSSNYVFPRATSPLWAEEAAREEEAHFNDLHAALSGQPSPRKPDAHFGQHGSRETSPGLDESAYVPFALSPSHSLGSGIDAMSDGPVRSGSGQFQGMPRGISNPDIFNQSSPRKAGMVSVHGDVLREYERLKRERKDLQDTIQQKEDENEAMTADLHARLEAAEGALAAKKKEEKEASTKVAQYAEQVTGLESELAVSQKHNATLESINNKQREQIESHHGELNVLRKKLTDALSEAKDRKNGEEHARELAESVSSKSEPRKVDCMLMSPSIHRPRRRSAICVKWSRTRLARSKS